MVASVSACSGMGVEGYGIQLLHGLGMPKFCPNPTIGFAESSGEARFSLCRGERTEV